MKTLTTTLSIFALLLSTTAFSLDLGGEINPPIRNDKPGIEIIISNNTTSNITPPLRPRDPGTVSNF